MLNNIKTFRKNLRMAEKCCNFASAIGRQTDGRLRGATTPAREAKIEYNDMKPQDKQRRPSGRTQQRQGNTGFTRGFRQKDSILKDKEGLRTKLEDIYIKDI